MGRFYDPGVFSSGAMVIHAGSKRGGERDQQDRDDCNEIADWGADSHVLPNMLHLNRMRG